jgi:hypothetical protein
MKMAALWLLSIELCRKHTDLHFCHRAETTLALLLDLISEFDSRSPSALAGLAHGHCALEFFFPYHNWHDSRPRSARAKILLLSKPFTVLNTTCDSAGRFLLFEIEQKNYRKRNSQERSGS